jgi:hypothetical protein
MSPDVEKYPPAVRELLAWEHPIALDSGSPNEAARAKLAALQPADFVPRGKLLDRKMAECCLAGLWLRHDFLHESHELSQEIHTSTGSFWHAIMHRREPDYPNSKYWLRQTGDHPAFAAIHEAAKAEFSRRPVGGNESTRAFAPLDIQALIAVPKWDPYRFVDLCQEACEGKDRELARACKTLQMIEWNALFDFCYERCD